MPGPTLTLHSSYPLTVGSVGNGEILSQLTLSELADSCDLVEIRLDLLDETTRRAAPWRKFEGFPILFTARRSSEGGSGDLDAATRMNLLREQLDFASMIDLEAASIGEMQALIDELKTAGIPWLSSFHDFSGVPDIARLQAARMAAHQAGATVFKAAVELGWQMDEIVPLGQFVSGSKDILVSLMGMGPLAPVSRVMFAQLGSVLNYGYLGSVPTAPGQWSARQLREAIQNVEKVSS